MIESPKRSLAKSITWRVVAVVILAIFSYQATGSLKTAAAITVNYHIIQVILFYIHERVWANIEWGFIAKKNKQKEKENELI